MNIENSKQDPRKEKDIADSVVCREILQEILKFGVNQYQMRKLIMFLALELDNNALMKKICSALESENRNKLTL